MRRSSAATYNLITLVFLFLTLFTFLGVLGLLTRVIAPPSFLRQAVAVAPTQVTPPTDTRTPTASSTLLPTDTPTASNTPTPLPPTNTITLTASNTPTPLPPSDTPTNSATPSQTPLPSKTPVPSKTPFPSRTPKGFIASKTPEGGAPVVSPTSSFPFALAAGFPLAGPNPDTTVGCAYQAISGQVLDMSSAPLKTKIRISVAGPKGIGVQTTPSPLNDTLYSPGSWVFPVDNKISSASFTVQILDGKNKPLSDKVKITFANDCQQNVIFVNFTQLRPVDLP